MAESGTVSTLTDVIGGCGTFQVVIVIVIKFATIASVWGVMFMSFGSFNPGWMCLDETNITTMKGFHYNATDTLEASSMPMSYYDGLTLNATDALEVIYYVPMSSDNLNETFTANQTKWTTNCQVKKNCKHLIFRQGYHTIVNEWDLTCELEWVPSLIISLTMIGALIGCICSGQIGDRFGRKVSVYFHIAIQLVVNVLIIFSTSWQMYAVLTFLNGYGSLGTSTATYAYYFEFINSFWRGISSAIPEWSISFLFFTLAAYFLVNWQYLHAISAVMCAVFFSTVFWTPESVRWLATHDKVNDAKEVVAKIARINGRSIPNTHVIDDIANEAKENKDNYSYSYLDLFKIPAVRNNILKFTFFVALMSWIYYVIVFSVKILPGNFLVNLILSAVLDIVATMVLCPLANIIGRRFSFLLFFFIAMLCCATLVVCSLAINDFVNGIGAAILALVIKCVIVAAWNLCVLLNIELFPTVLRNTSFGLIGGVSRASAIISPFIFSSDPNKMYLPFSIMGILCGIAFGIIFTISDTRGKELEDNIVGHEVGKGTQYQTQ